ncbi:NAD-dependent epimerase dehydratase [Grosmannia clavigera kw1407]|uniref:NAD-dependent epimerase dehydratase n=1 Tax=Grosmannia clavigera (strain kw1407 / UAMH 11150) TaxID=655863 RepID=F0X7P4_GROCL|nr:NAD-dependent epimerase dehydratase [Grosmannia clavigera kw1407]EFX06361.1 NAD-dependent epimerase dehydratase [Grosmannia clavigera kw1407]
MCWDLVRVFVTGSTGFIGTAVVKELVSAGHSVVGLTRSDKGQEQLKSQGAKPLRGAIEDLELFKKTAFESDAVIHLAFIHDLANFLSACETDRAAIKALGSALAASVAAAKVTGASADRALVITSGTSGLAPKTPGEPATEDDQGSLTNPISVARNPSETVCLDFAKQGVRASVVRLPPTTYGPGTSGFMSLLIGTALQKGVSGYISGEEEDKYSWSACHRDDAATLYRLAMEKAGQSGGPSIFNAVSQQSVHLKDIAQSVGKPLDLPVTGIQPDWAAEHFGWFQVIMTMKNVVSSAKTREALGWTPTSPPLLEHLPIIVDFAKSQTH